MHEVLELKTQKLKVLTDFIASVIQFPVSSLILLNAATKTQYAKLRWRNTGIVGITDYWLHVNSEGFTMWNSSKIKMKAWALVSLLHWE